MKIFLLLCLFYVTMLQCAEADKLESLFNLFRELKKAARSRLIEAEEIVKRPGVTGEELIQVQKVVRKTNNTEEEFNRIKTLIEDLPTQMAELKPSPKEMLRHLELEPKGDLVLKEDVILEVAQHAIDASAEARAKDLAELQPGLESAFGRAHFFEGNMTAQKLNRWLDNIAKPLEKFVRNSRYHVLRDVGTEMEKEFKRRGMEVTVYNFMVRDKSGDYQVNEDGKLVKKVVEKKGDNVVKRDGENVIENA